MNSKYQLNQAFYWVAIGWVLYSCNPDSGRGLSRALTFYASFDGGARADFAAGDANVYTADSFSEMGEAQSGLHSPHLRIEPNQGRHGDALKFISKNEMAIFYKSQGNLAYSRDNWNGTVSFWLSLDPESDLEPGYCDPIQITDAAWNDGALWVDFDQEPRNFRLGIMGDLESWNPKGDTALASGFFDDRVVTVEDPPFERGKWTHVVFTFSDLNTGRGRGDLYLNGVHRGATNDIEEAYEWDEAVSAIRLGISYVGMFDELALFNRVLSAEEVSKLHQLPNGVGDLIK